jgi:hypothetical protein
LESKRPHQPQLGVDGHTSPSDVPGVLRDLRLEKDDMQPRFNATQTSDLRWEALFMSIVFWGFPATKKLAWKGKERPNLGANKHGLAGSPLKRSVAIEAGRRKTETPKRLVGSPASDRRRHAILSTKGELANRWRSRTSRRLPEDTTIR